MLAALKWRWPTPHGLPPLRWVFALSALAAALYLTAGVVEVNTGQFARSASHIVEFASHFLATPAWDFLPHLLQKLLETYEIAFIATTGAIVISLPLGILAARNATINMATFYICRLILSFIRALPEIVWALVLVSAVGLGPLPGVLALMIVTVGFLAKFFAEAIEVVDRRPVEGVDAHGAGWLQRRLYGMAPQAIPDMVGIVLLIFEHNVRAATVLGLVGAGGIGYDMVMSMRLFRFDRLILIMAAIYITVTILDRVSHAIRKRII